MRESAANKEESRFSPSLTFPCRAAPQAASSRLGRFPSPKDRACRLSSPWLQSHRIAWEGETPCPGKVWPPREQALWRELPPTGLSLPAESPAVRTFGRMEPILPATRFEPTAGVLQAAIPVGSFHSANAVDLPVPAPGPEVCRPETVGTDYPQTRRS